ncbi:MAG: SMC family ATPase [Drouetiella hepatica Uher 2000/2452]|jgi:exonuclease SbcC|uniref:Nuclease SbcCD subunit C n=1 Tax=Drouetiella hepatica Uher 2000/2452 TaxID=904376 RepID=A0A951Q8M9_9CYAN|nr:SMC family ATPase [Drouetiella hepatica Uher 2000/2452]
MEILSVTLKNFKSHSDRHFAFQPGTNAICGENGAGKTSILEAIAWAMFNYRGGYNKEDLIRNGSNSAQVTIAFVSSRDGRTYEVQRCTTKGYTLYDPQLDTKLDYKHIEDEVLPWLRQQFGVAPGTDLARLFANTIGVPQGMFTADFLLSSEKRKPIFDAILKVEEYRMANQQMLSLEKYGKAESEGLERSIAQYNESLQEWESLRDRHLFVSREIAASETALAGLQTELATLQVEKDRLTAQAQQVQQTSAKLQNLTVQIEGKQPAITLLNQSVQRAQAAVQVCQENRENYQTYVQAEVTLKELDQQAKQRQSILRQREAQQKGLTDLQTQLTKLDIKREALDQASADLEQLQPFIAQQTELEQQQLSLIEQLNQLQALKPEQQNLSRQMAKIRAEQTKLSAEIERIRSLESLISQIPDLELKRDRLQEQLSRVEAAKQFESELRQLVSQGEAQRDRHQSQAEQALATLQAVQQTVPLLASASVEAALATIRLGVELNTDLLNALWRILSDLSEQISVSKLQEQLRQIKTQLEAGYQHRAEFAALDSKQAQQTHWQTESAQLQERIDQIAAALAAEPDWLEKRSHFIAELNQLANPKGQAQLLVRDLQQADALSRQYAALKAQSAKLEEAIALLETQLMQFAELEDQIEQQKQLRQTHQPTYLIYMQHRNDANQLAKLQADLHLASEQLAELVTEQSALQVEYEHLTQTYDPQQWQQIQTLYEKTRSEADRLAGGLPQQQKLMAQLDSQLAILDSMAEKRDRAQADLKQKDKVRKFISFARKVYKEAGPRITERYVQNISREADRLFRELLNRPNVALEWTRDYEIMVQEGAHSRRFINLSGGEQMCAALAVRLALLRVLADIDIAFFDEPTTNMDRPRRESLAEAIANIKSFRQLFVISHDDTFEKITENIILVERDPLD